MPRITRNTKPADILSYDLPKETNMAAKQDLTLQDVINQLSTSIKHLETKLETKIDANADKVTNTLKVSADKLDNIDRNTADLNQRVGNLEKEAIAKDRVIRQSTSKIDILEQERRNHFVIIEGLPEERNDNLRRKLDELFMALELPYDSEWIDLASWDKK